MELVLFDTENKYTPGFIAFVLRRIKAIVITSINPDKLVLIDNYLQAIENIDEMAYDLIIEAINNLKAITINQKITISVDKLKNISGTTAKLYDIINLINTGNLALRGYPIITEAFNYIKNNIDDLYDIYVNGGF